MCVSDCGEQFLQASDKVHRNGDNEGLQIASNSQGLGTSGHDLFAINSNASSSSKATIPFLHPKFGDRFFNPFEFLSESSKGEPQRKFNLIYRVQPFWCLISLDTYVRRSPPPTKKSNVASKYDQLAKALSFVCHIVQENERIHGKKVLKRLSLDRG